MYHDFSPFLRPIQNAIERFDEVGDLTGEDAIVNLGHPSIRMNEDRDTHQFARIIVEDRDTHQFARIILG